MAKVNVSLSDDLLEKVDALAAEQNRSRSGLVQEATAQYVVRMHDEQEREQRRRTIETAMTDARELAGLVPPGDDATAMIRRDRDGDYGSARPDE